MNDGMVVHREGFSVPRRVPHMLQPYSILDILAIEKTLLVFDETAGMSELG